MRIEANTEDTDMMPGDDSGHDAIKPDDITFKRSKKSEGMIDLDFYDVYVKGELRSDIEAVVNAREDYDGDVSFEARIEYGNMGDDDNYEICTDDEFADGDPSNEDMLNSLRPWLAAKLSTEAAKEAAYDAYLASIDPFAESGNHMELGKEHGHG